MFAVPGWSLGKLETQEEHRAAKSDKSSKKRKRNDKEEAEPRVTRDNVSALWQQHIERREGVAADFQSTHAGKHASHKSKNADKKAISPSEQSSTSVKRPPHIAIEAGEPQSIVTEEKKKKKKRERKSTPPLPDAKIYSDESKLQDQKPIASKHAPPKLTPMQAAMRQKLISARFRHLNQTLYTSPSMEAGELFEANPTFFEEYHAGFRQQVSTWPENPVDSYVVELRQRGKVQRPEKGKQMPGKKAAHGKEYAGPLPRTHGVCTVADLGCGEGHIASQLRDTQGSLALGILSYDLYSNNPLVTKCDISRLPLEDDSVNVAIFCLALMGTNWIDFIEEAWRILHWKGELWVAEIKSRFGRVKTGPPKHSVGRRRKAGKQQLEGDDIDHHERLRTEVDGADERKDETDVSAFVAVLERRGFVLQSDHGVDRSNKMFVKLRFLKAKTPAKGKYLGQGAKGRPDANLAGGDGRGQQSRRDEAHDEGDETQVLKPCLYKIR